MRDEHKIVKVVRGYGQYDIDQKDRISKKK